MKLDSNTVLITGGATGIGLGLARRFLQAGSEVIVCGRREEKLREAKRDLPALRVHACDLAEESGRISLFEWATGEFPALNVLVNNAGIQERVSLLDRTEWERAREEIAINFEAPVHLSMLFLPHLLGRKSPAIVNVTSGLAFSPLARVPIYCATKAALHSFTLSLRHQLAATPVRVIEIVPPAVDTDLGGVGLHKFGVPVEELLDAVMPRIENGEEEVAYGFSHQSSRASREELGEIFRRTNAGP